MLGSLYTVDFICDVEGLEQVVGTRQLPALLKSIDFLDEHCGALLSRSPFAVIGYTDRAGERRAGAIGGSSGFATIEDRDRLRLPTPPDAMPGAPASTMFLIPGWREALRINGRVDHDDPGLLVVDEAFVHCGKAVLRSNLWSATEPDLEPAPLGQPPLTPEVRAFLTASPFVVMTSQDASGAADASPKGDPPGFIEILDDATVAIPDRRGNRRTDTFHNLIEDPSVAFLALVPGDERVLELRGTARITDDETLRYAMDVKGKVPHAALVLDITACELIPSPAIGGARLWDPSTHQDLSDLPKAGQIWTDHVKANRTGGLKAAAIRAAVNGKVVQAGTEVEYQRSLY